MIKIGPYEFPETCPENCAFIEEIKQFSMTSICFRCPVINCAPCFDEHGNDMRPLDPEHFDIDLAKQWDEFFKTGQFPEEDSI